MFVKVQPTDGDVSPKEETIFTRPFFRIVRWILLLGAVHPGHPWQNDLKNSRCFAKLKNVFIAVCVVLYLANMSLMCYDLYITAKKSEVFARQLSFVVIFASSIYLTVACSIVMSQQLPKLEEMFCRFENSFGVSNRVSHLPRYFKLSIIGLIVNVVLSFTFQGSILTRSVRLLCDSVPLCNIPQPLYWILLPVYLVMAFIINLQWAGLFIICAFFAIVFAREFNHVTENFKELSNCQKEVEETFRNLVEKHTSLVRLLDGTNCCFQHFSFVGLFLLIPVSSFFLYSSLGNIDDSLEMLYLLSGMCSSLSTIAIRLILEARVNRKAHAPLEYLWQLRQKRFSDRGLHHLSMFMNRLMGDSIGYNIFGILTINMPALLGIFGTLATYIIIVVQFRPTDSPCHCDCMKNVSYCIMDQ